MTRPPKARDQIFQAARRIVESRGAGHLTFEELSAESGVTRGGITYHFPTKEALLKALIEADIDDWEKAAESLESGCECPQAAAYMGRDVEQLTPAIHWALIRLAWASVADTAIAPLQDVLGLASEHRMNLPGEGEGHWAWRFGWDMVRPEHAEQLATLTRLYGRG